MKKQHTVTLASIVWELIKFVVSLWISTGVES